MEKSIDIGIGLINEKYRFSETAMTHLDVIELDVGLD